MDKNVTKKIRILSKIMYILCKIGYVISLVGIVLLISIMFAIPIINNKEHTLHDLYSENLDGQRYYCFDDETNISSNIDAVNKLVMCSEVSVASLEVSSLFLILKLLIVFIIINIVHDIFKNTYENQAPFCDKNSKNLFRIGILLIGSAVITSLFCLMSNTFFGVSFSINLDIKVIFTGLFFLMLSLIFKYGTELQMQSDTTL